MQPSIQWLTIDAKSPSRQIAIRNRKGTTPGIFWLGGFMSDMHGTKAQALDQWAANQGKSCVRFDYSGHGESVGDLKTGTIGGWLEESLAVFTRCCEGPQIIVGSSMGGWLALLLARAFQRIPNPKQTICSLVLIAPAVDFTETLISQQLSAHQRKEIQRQGFLLSPSDDSNQPYCITRQLLEEGRNHLLLNGDRIEVNCPIYILQGMKDNEVPWEHAMQLMSKISSDDMTLTLIKDGDHRLARPKDIESLLATVQRAVDFNDAQS